ncbi:histidinol-phosphatase HisJ [Alkalicoccobacillus murimartini]|uniref:Histidinol-phosphatase n=1 Tax=Alkalicoccobacillus murimartini TaxID=171685 RepID=A0ABT9YJU4_9BACI|nr:histidinol-phosphatase HisJ [Alkalicoccobacillus murimartini]MDQ0208131.1 histidinol-phosphatase (PHP family) [Alkalicoccobacillus murimartini]
MLKYDGHVHSPFCPHGTKDTLNSYCEKALEIGLTGLTFTEHAPLPEGFVDPAPNQDSAMSKDQLYSYIEHVQSIQEKYKNELTIGLGLEVDYIEGFEEETTSLLNEVGPVLTDSILSVHFLKHNDIIYCMDHSPEMFLEIATSTGSVDAVHQLYYQTLLQSIEADLGAYKPNRMGHITLANKFQKKVPTTQSFEREIQKVLQAMKAHGYSLDYNVAGIRKPLCKESYPPILTARLAVSMGIPLVFGSDAHQAKELPLAWNEYTDLPLSNPFVK